MMAEWATIEHKTGVQPPPLPPPIDLAETVRAATHPTSGASWLGRTAFALDNSPITPPLQLRDRGCKTQNAAFPGLTRADVAELVELLSSGPDVLGCDLSGDYLGDDAVCTLIEALSNCKRLTSLWLAHNDIGPRVVAHLAKHMMREFPARVPPEEDPFILTAKAVAGLRSELELLPADALRQRAVAMGVDQAVLENAIDEARQEAMEKAKVEAAKAAAAEEEEAAAAALAEDSFERELRLRRRNPPVGEEEEPVAQELGPAHKALIDEMVRPGAMVSQSLANGSAEHGGVVDGATGTAHASVARSLAQMPRLRPFGLRVLALSNNRIGDVGARRLAAIMTRPHCQLVSVHLAGNDISDIGAEDLAKAIATEDTQLVNLNLAGNFITNMGAKKIADALDLNRSIATLALERNPIVRAVDADEKRAELKSFSPSSFCLKSARKTAARSFVYTYTLMNQEKADPQLHRVRLHCQCSNGAGSYTESTAVISRNDYLLTQLMELNGVGGSSGETKTSLDARGLVKLGVPASYERPSEHMTPLGLLWSEDHCLLARIAFRLSLCPGHLKGREAAAATPRAELWSQQLEAALYPPSRTSAKSLYQRAVTLVQIDLVRKDGRSNSDLMAAYDALKRCLAMLDKEEAEGGAEAQARAQALNAAAVVEESERPTTRGSDRPMSRESSRPTSRASSRSGHRASPVPSVSGEGARSSGTNKAQQYVEKLKQTTHAAALVAGYDGVHRHEVQVLLEGVEVELALPVEARFGRHHGDICLKQEKWEQAHKAYTSALEHGHTKEVCALQHNDLIVEFKFTNKFICLAVLGSY